MVEKRFSNKIVVITGATRGIGLACAERFALEGAKICTIQGGKWEIFDSSQCN